MISKDQIVLVSDSRTESEDGVKRFDLPKITLFSAGDLHCGIVQAGKTTYSTHAADSIQGNNILGSVPGLGYGLAMSQRILTDEQIRNALFAIANVAVQTREAHDALTRLVAQKLPDLPPDGRAALLSSLEKDKTRLEQLQRDLKTALGQV
ncbi:MAG: hypothetical protein Q7S40_08330 [Opitutaceae bacterium]|nr:hypothetical protein [Opitutaceae bacterium]